MRGWNSVLIDHPFRIAVDQSADTPAQTVDLTIKSPPVHRSRSTNAGRVEAAPELAGKPSRIFKTARISFQTAYSRRSLRTG